MRNGEAQARNAADLVTAVTSPTPGTGQPTQTSEATDALLDKVASVTTLAVRRKLPLASRDEALCRAAERCRVKLLL